MPLSKSYSHVYVFAACFVAFALMVALNSDRTVALTERFLEDSREVQTQVAEAYEWVRKFNVHRFWRESELFIRTVIAAPTAPLEAVAFQLEEINDRIAHR